MERIIVNLLIVCTVIGTSASILSTVDLSRIELKKLFTTEQRILSHGYPAESHYVETSDGYVLNIFRIPYSHKLANQNTKRPVVLLQHGLLSNSDCWLNSGPDNAMAYNFADAGYDVWLGNARGNTYSRNNTKISLQNPKFWHFTWHEIGVIDIPTIIDYIIKQTQQDAIHYVGHSQGTTVFFVLMSERPEYNSRIKSAHMLAPCAFLGNGSSFIFKLFAPLVGLPGSLWESFLSDTEMMPQNPIISRLADTSCGEDTSHRTYCRNMYLWFIGEGYVNANASSVQVLIETHPGGASTNQGIHYMQLHVSKKFRQFDYGEKKNQQFYNQSTPPDYNLRKITAPTYLYSGAKDGTCVQEDLDILVSEFPNLSLNDYRIPDSNWNHLDFLVATQLKEIITERVIRITNAHNEET